MVDCEVCGESDQPGTEKSCVIFSVVAGLILLIITECVRNKIAEVDVDCDNRSLDFNETFIDRCKTFGGYDCPKVWDAFEQAYVGRDKCDVPMEAYDPVFALAPFRHNYSRTLLWSNSQDFVGDFSNKKCFVVMNDTMLGAAVDGYNWYGKEGSRETCIASSRKWKECENYNVKSFWRGFSAKFAEAAEGQVTAMLNGSSDPPFKPTSIFANIEVPRLNPTKVQSLNVVLVTPEISVVDCTHSSFTRLREKLKQGIEFTCKEVLRYQIQECKDNKEKSCEDCW